MNNRKTRDKKPPVRHSDNGEGAEFLLRAEVAFWREMIGSCDDDYPAASRERMQHALAFAEYRLMRCYRPEDGPAGSTAGPDKSSANSSNFIH